MDRAGFIPRMGAFLIDFAIFAMTIHLLVAIDIVINTLGDFNNFGVVSLLGGSILLIVYGFLEVIMAGTPGKKICGLVIADEEGRPAGMRLLMKRWAFKHCAVFMCAPTLVLWTLLSPHNYHFPLPDFVAAGVLALAVTDTVLTAILLAIVIGGCFLALRPHGQALHDMLAGTTVQRRLAVDAAKAFSPVMVDKAG
jgi:uncharacterized RDD family membrane protein YckC